MQILNFCNLSLKGKKGLVCEDKYTRTIPAQLNITSSKQYSSKAQFCHASLKYSSKPRKGKSESMMDQNIWPTSNMLLPTRI